MTEKVMEIVPEVRANENRGNGQLGLGTIPHGVVGRRVLHCSGVCACTGEGCGEIVHRLGFFDKQSIIVELFDEKLLPDPACLVVSDPV
nr:hypothetical protein [Tanacetum cinerariifolium]